MGLSKISESREEDRAYRVELLAQMKEDLKNNLPITAKHIGKMTKWLDEQIKNSDYSETDARRERLKKLFKGTHFENAF